MRITTPFTSRSTADEVSDGVDLTGRRAVVTGGASGIGVETARTLARRGAAVTLAVRDVGRAREVAAEITRTTVLVATSPLLDGVGGRYFNDNQEAVPVSHRPESIEELVASVAPYSLDPQNADRLWHLSARAVGLN
jgi:NAD(P)-dependent dehydrogenase (short-subunit alcohol dehydrogenase family)